VADKWLLRAWPLLRSAKPPSPSRSGLASLLAKRGVAAFTWIVPPRLSPPALTGVTPA
jgi:hypothetical protein